MERNNSQQHALGSRKRSSIPMTPRNRSFTGANIFARQLAEHRRESQQQPPAKKLKPSSAPKGSKLASGYQDRTALRRQAETEADGPAVAGGDDDDDDNGGRGGGARGYGKAKEKKEEKDDGEEDRAKRLAALEQMANRGEIDQTTFETMRKELGVGGDLGSTHLVKGLDFELLRRVKAGEDVSTAAAAAADTSQGKPLEADDNDGDREGGGADDDAEFDRVLEEAVEPRKREAKSKKGNMAPPPPPLPRPAPDDAAAEGGKMTRDEILKRLKASRAHANANVTTAGPKPVKEEPPVSTLGAKFKKLGDTGGKKRWVETDKNGRRKEVLLTTDSEGKTKRKARWLDNPADAQQGSANGGLLPVDKDATPLGMEVPAAILSRTKTTEEEEEDDDIFQGVGADYNPLSEDSDSTSESGTEEETKRKEPEGNNVKNEEDKEPGAPVSGPSQPRDYFSTRPAAQMTQTAESKTDSNPLTSDPTIMGALKRAASIRQGSTTSGGISGDTAVEEDGEERRKQFLEEARKRDMQDAMDMDMGFGGSRFGDEDDETAWQDGGAGGNKRKRGPKKKKGNKESAGDVMKVLEGRQKAGDKT